MSLSLLAKSGLILIVAGGSLGCSSSTTAPFAARDPQVQVQTLATGLDSPRGMTFGPDGQLYLAEAGRGPVTYDPAQPTIFSPSVQQNALQFGTTGAISRINPQTGTLERLLTNLPSIAIPLGFPGPGAGTDGLGPTDLAFAANGTLYMTLGFGGDPNSRTVLGGGATSLAALTQVNLQTQTFQVIADLGAFEGANNPDGDDVISNPYRLEIAGQQVLLVDAGANVLLQTNLDGSGLAVQAVFDQKRTVPAPPIPGLPPQLDIQQVPTAVSLNPAGEVFVSELTGFPYPVGLARVLRIDGATPVAVATGFTMISDIAYSAQGDLWVLEYDSDGLGPNTTGSLIQVLSTGTRRVIVDDLVAPTGLALGPDGSVYIANRGFVVGEGEILRLTFS